MVYRDNAKPSAPSVGFVARAWRAFLGGCSHGSVLVSLSLAFVLLMAGGGVSDVRLQPFSRQYVQPLQTAVISTDPEAVLLSLQRAIRYAEANGLTHGDASQPSSDLLTWHRTLIAAAAEVATLTPTTPIEERRRVLARVRQMIAGSDFQPRVPEAMTDSLPNRRLMQGLLWAALACVVAALVQTAVLEGHAARFFTRS